VKKVDDISVRNRTGSSLVIAVKILNGVQVGAAMA
jgi:hypothetical protein